MVGRSNLWLSAVTRGWQQKFVGPIFSWGIKAISSNKRFLVSGRNSMLLEANLVWKKNDFSVGEVISSRTNRFVVGHSDFPLSAVT